MRMMTVCLLSLGLVTAGAVADVSPARADGVYVTITGLKQGRLRGPSQYQGRLLALSYFEATTGTRDPQSGQLTGAPTSGSYVISAEWGTTLPQLLTAITTDEIMSEVKFEFFRENGGRDEVYYVVTLTNAKIDSVNGDFAPGNAAGLPAAVFTVSFFTTHIAFTDPTVPAPQPAPVSGGVSAAGLRANVAMVAHRQAPVITPSLYRQMAKPRTSASEPGQVNDAWMRVTSPAGPFHAEAADHPGQTTQVRSFSFGVRQPRNQMTGLPSGQRIWAPMTFTKATGSASADFQQAVHNSTTLDPVTIFFLEHTAGGTEQTDRTDYRFTLGSAIVASDQTTMSGGTSQEKISFTFQSVSIGDQIAGLGMHDSH